MTVEYWKAENSRHCSRFKDKKYCAQKSTHWIFAHSQFFAFKKNVFWCIFWSDDFYNMIQSQCTFCSVLSGAIFLEKYWFCLQKLVPCFFCKHSVRRLVLHKKETQLFFLVRCSEYFLWHSTSRANTETQIIILR